MPNLPLKTHNNRGILDAFHSFPLTAVPMSNLAEHLLNTNRYDLSRAYRERIASYVSLLNGVNFCQYSHGHVSNILHGSDEGLLEPEVYTLLEVIVRSPKSIPQAMGKAATVKTPEQLHDIVAIVAAFCMFNTYVKTLGLHEPNMTTEDYRNMAQHIVDFGYTP